MEEINLNLNLNEVNAILTGLTEIPYKVAAGIIDKIHMQARAQLEPPKESI